MLLITFHFSFFVLFFGFVMNAFKTTHLLLSILDYIIKVSLCHVPVHHSKCLGPIFISFFFIQHT